MAATILNSSMILNESLMLLEGTCNALKAVNRQFDNQFGKEGTYGKPGTSLKIRKPIEVTVREGRVAQPQDTVEETVTISCTNQVGVDLPAFTSEQMKMNINDFSKQYLQTPMATLASYIDKKVLEYYSSFYHSVGVAGTTPNTYLVFGQAKQKLVEVGATMNDGKVKAIIDPDADVTMADALKGLFGPRGKLDDQYNSGSMKPATGLEFLVDQNVKTHTNGTRVGTILVDDNTSTNIAEGMTTIHIDGLTNATDTVKAGDVFTIANVYAVSPLSKVQYGHLQQFTVTADATAASNEVDITFTPAIRSTGARQNVSALPADGAAVSFYGAASGQGESLVSRQNLVLHEDAMTMVTADLMLPKGVHEAARKKYKNISMRMITDYNSTNDTFLTRFDIFYGITVVRPELGVRVWG